MSVRGACRVNHAWPLWTREAAFDRENLMSDASAFSPDYVSARARFRAAAHALGARLEAHPIGIDGPDGEPLTLDVAVLGATSPTRSVVVSSGLHGVEGFFGSAVQCALLEDVLGGFHLPDDGALVFLHALNPYGFANLRRVNEGNIDLNRNFLREGEAYSGAPDGYAALDGLLNPPQPPGPGTRPLFYARAVWNILRHGLPTLKQAVAGGQYAYQRGLFFGGSGPSRTQQILDAELPRWVGSARRVIHIDFHTGLGARGTYKLFADHPWGSEQIRALADGFGHDRVEPWEPEQGVSYEIRGGLGAWCKARLPSVEYDVLAAEFGTVHILKVIAALHEENRAHHWAQPTDPATVAAKRRLRDVFAPPERAWRDAVVPKGIHIVQQAIEQVFA